MIPRRSSLVFAALLAACSGHDATPPAVPAPQLLASVAAFDAESTSIDAGQTATLRWDVAGAANVAIEPGIGTVAAAGSIAVRPAVTTTYTLTATDARGRAVHSAFTVNVNQPPAEATAWPILFVTQVPMHTDAAARLSTFANHLTDPDKAPRGGDLWLRYPDGELRNLTREAGFGNDGLQGAGAIAVREPSVHWSGTRALFSMLVGSPDAGEAPVYWQIYEVSGLARGERAKIVRVPDQPAGFNNLSPLYSTDGRVLFTSDRPRSGEAHLYPQLDEYEATPTTTGIWQLDPASGKLAILEHAPSGAFSPFVDSYGRIVFTRWDHLQQDQLAQRDRDALHNGVALPFGSFNYAGEDALAPPTASRDEVFPEPRAGSSGVYGAVSPHTFNFFSVWQMNEDGSGEETLNHVGLHELSFGAMTPTFKDDPALSDHTDDRLHANRLALRREAGLFQLREDPRRPGSYVATVAREANGFGTGQLVALSGAPALNGEQMQLTALTAAADSDIFPQGRYRNPLPLSDGRLVASHTASTAPPETGDTLTGLRLRFLTFDAASGLFQAGAPLTPGLAKTVSWRAGGALRSYSGELWELEAVELRPRTRPARGAPTLEAPERAVLAEENVSEDELRAWLASRELALIVTRNQTSRDRADTQQPFNLRVPGGVKTVSAAAPGARVYDIAHFQLFDGEQLRAYPGRAGRRVIARPLAGGLNPPTAGPAGSVRIAPDGSTAAFVPARRALTWQSTDAAGNAVVRERNWISFQPGEMRTCAACHGINARDQAGLGAPANRPQALRELLKYWKTLPK